MLSMIIPTICHFLFDYLLMINLEYSFLLFIVFVVIMFSTALSKVKRLSNIPTNIFNKPERIDFVYNAFGNYAPNNQRFCPNCKSPINGNFCGNCGSRCN